MNNFDDVLLFDHEVEGSTADGALFIHLIQYFKVEIIVDTKLTEVFFAAGRMFLAPVKYKI